jgi:hypothetical protein
LNWILKVANLATGTFNAQKFNIGTGRAIPAQLFQNPMPFMNPS